ncbi:hypothetical protein VTL71DRAFT_2558 [Oculimacula yallundae]|uniref:DJ-1/PfpI domain-containing protein n=1 Tax=Oculimacula yallundae TaxID=86028 RepID=A0ABR4C963_9HELO
MKSIIFLFLATLAICHDTELPINFGMLLFPGFQPVDVIGPMDVFNTIGTQYKIHTFFVTETTDPVPFGVQHLPWFTPRNITGSTSEGAYVATYNFTSAPPIDVLLIPGGIGNRAPIPLFNSTIDYVKEVYPSLKYLFTVCTGSGIAARAGVLDGKRATTNKMAWAPTILLGPKVKWVAEARWVQDGNIWTSSGVMAGIDAAYAFVSEIYSETVSLRAANMMEYVRHPNSTDDPFATLNGLTNEKNSTHPVV